MNRTTQRILFALPFAVVALAAGAQTTPGAPDARPSLFQHLLQKMDTNGDGRISEQEFLAAATARFKSIDAKNAGSVDAQQLAASPAAAERLHKRAQFLVRRLDKAGNGYVTRDEFVAEAQRRFARLDANGDGKLTPDEFARHGRHEGDARNPDSPHARFAQHRFDRLDANHDGVVTQDEFVAAAVTRFQQFDLEATGKVTADEIAASPRARARAERAAEHIVRRLDTNGDGRVSQDEYLAMAKKRFSRMDKNGDGYIDADEIPAHHWARGGTPVKVDG